MRSLDLLSDFEFEEVCGDLLAAEFGVHFERFRRAPDGGVDLRSHDHAGLRIVQCKHYQRSRFDRLYRELEKEIPNVEREAPREYLVATSLELTRQQKDRIFLLFEKWMSDPGCIYGGHDIDALLTKHSDVERRYVKLWLASGGTLDTMLHAATHERSRHLCDRIEEALPRYVQGRSLAPALDILDRHRVCIISGPPGIGKSMLAQVMVAHSIRTGFEAVEVSDDIDEAWAVLDPRARQIFYYDDFLGRITFGETLRKNEDHRLVAFIDKINSTESKRMVLTTREYIFETARDSYDELRRLDDRLKLVLKLSHYSRMDRARMLYQHLWHADLAARDLDSVLGSRRYLEIIDHPNFSPRLIEHMTRPPITQAI